MIIETANAKWRCNGPFGRDRTWFLFETDQGDVRLEFTVSEAIRLHTMLSALIYEAAQPGYMNEPKRRYEEAMAAFAAASP